MIIPMLCVTIFVILVVWFLLLFSSRRRHTTCLSDWSSDVCSSDLGQLGEECGGSRDIAAWPSKAGNEPLIDGKIGRAAGRGIMVFDTLTLADDRLEAFYDNPTALRDYFSDIGCMVIPAEGSKDTDS